MINYHARQLTDAAAGSHGVTFTPRADGSGLFCFPPAKGAPHRLEICRGWSPPEALSKATLARLKSVCRPRFKTSRVAGKLRGAKKAVAPKTKTKSNFAQAAFTPAD